MNNLIIALIAWWFAEGSGLMQEAMFLTKWKGRCKPFDCPMCLAFWMGCIYNYNEGWMLVVYGIICSSLAIFISKIYNRI